MQHFIEGMFALMFFLFCSQLNEKSEETATGTATATAGFYQIKLAK
jgi:hypothetical protein